jgi:hypothetical protein
MIAFLIDITAAANKSSMKLDEQLHLVIDNEKAFSRADFQAPQTHIW